MEESSVNSQTEAKSPFLYIVAGVLLGAVICVLSFILFTRIFTGESLRSPSSDQLARDYLDAIIQQDVEKAVALAYPGCEASVRRDALADIALYGGAEVMEVRILVGSGTGSDDNYQIVQIEFLYRREGMDNWQDGEIRISTTYGRESNIRGIYCGG